MSQDKNGVNRGAGRDPDTTRRGYAPQGKNYLFVVGIDTYRKLPHLYNAVRDAKDVIEELTTKYQFSKDQLVTLFNEEATQSAIIRQLEQYAETITDRDSLLIYFSGHGEFAKIIDTGYWIPVDGRSGEIGTFLSFDMVTRFVRAIPSHHTFIIADSCYSGAIFTDRKAGDVLDHLESIPSRWVLTAGRNEVVSDGQQGTNSPFADAVLYRLRNNEEPRLPVSAFCNYIITDVRNNANQLPRGASMHGVGDRGGEFMFRLKKFAETVFEEKVPAEAIVPKGPSGDDTTPPKVTPPPRPEIPDTFDSPAALKKTMKNLVTAHTFDDLFDLFERAVRSDVSVHDDLLLQQSQYNRLRRDEAQQTVPAETINISKNRLASSLLYYINQLSESDLQKHILDKNGGGTDLSNAERQSLERQKSLWQRKVNYLEEEEIKLSDPNQKFSLSVQLEEARTKLKEINIKLGEA